VNATQFRRMALAMAGAVEGAHMGHPDFRANGRIFATLHAGNKTGMVKLPPDLQKQFLEADPETFSPASGAWGRQGCTIVRLASAGEELLGEAMTLAWQGIAKAAPQAAQAARRVTRAQSKARPARIPPKSNAKR
jgi:hypothetical protein